MMREPARSPVADLRRLADAQVAAGPHGDAQGALRRLHDGDSQPERARRRRATPPTIVVARAAAARRRPTRPPARCGCSASASTTSSIRRARLRRRRRPAALRRGGGSGADVVTPVTISAASDAVPTFLRRFPFQALALLLAVLVVMALRQSDKVLYPQFWAEDASIFYLEAEQFGLVSLLHPYNGYWHLFPRSVALIGTRVPILFVPVFYAIAALVVSTLALVMARARRPRRVVASTHRRGPDGAARAVLGRAVAHADQRAVVRRAAARRAARCARPVIHGGPCRAERGGRWRWAAAARSPSCSGPASPCAPGGSAIAGAPGC